MARTPFRFTEGDVDRALAPAIKRGLKVKRYTVNLAGDITVIIDDHEPQESTANDDIEIRL